MTFWCTSLWLPATFFWCIFPCGMGLGYQMFGDVLDITLYNLHRPGSYPKRKRIFQSSIFRCELLVSVGENISIRKPPLFGKERNTAFAESPVLSYMLCPNVHQKNPLDTLIFHNPPSNTKKVFFWNTQQKLVAGFTKGICSRWCCCCFTTLGIPNPRNSYCVYIKKNKYIYI